jgi:HK97 family phage major capsid protein/HK97 family phage prohead protease
VVEPKGAKFNLPLPFLWQHQSGQPIGHVIAAKVTAAGIEIRAQLANLTEPGKLKDRLDEAWQTIKAGLVRGLSIGFSPIEYEPLDPKRPWDAQRFMTWEWLELSAVTIAANADASIQTIKSIDTAQRAASGNQRTGAVRLDTSPGASGTKATPKPTEGTKMKTIAEQIAAAEAQRQAKHGRMSELMTKAGEAGTTLDKAESEEYDTLTDEVADIEKHIDRLKKHEAIVLTKAVAPAGQNAQEAATTRGGAPAIILNREPEEKFKGQFFTRKVIAKALASIEHVPMSAIASALWGKSHPRLVEVIKANEISSGSSDTWGSELVSADNRFTGDFIEFLYSKTVFDRLGLRQVPANVSIKGQDGQATGYWVGESKPIPVSAPSFSAVSLTPLKVAALAVVSNELLRDSTPAAEMLVRDALIQALAQKTDSTFLSTTAASAGVSPAGILNGVVSIGSHGTDGDGVRGDIRALYAAFLTAKNASGLSVVTNTSLAKGLQLLTNALGQPEFPGVTQNGGTLIGDPLVTGENVGTGHLILLKPSDIYRIGDDGLRIEMSRDATIEMSSAPVGAADTPTGQTQNPVSMFQDESTAIKVVRSINFAKRRSDAVQYIRDAAYGESAST